MPTFDITAYAVTRIKVNDVEGADAKAAIEKVREFLPLDELLNREDLSHECGAGEITYVANAEDVQEFLVDAKDEDGNTIDDGVAYDGYGFKALLPDEEHADFPRYQWRNAVANAETVSGYQDWVSHQLQSRAEATPG